MLFGKMPEFIALLSWRKACGLIFVIPSARFCGPGTHSKESKSLASKESLRRATVGLSLKSRCSWRVEIVV